jgi:hypothetical protein
MTDTWCDFPASVFFTSLPAVLHQLLFGFVMAFTFIASYARKDRNNRDLRNRTEYGWSNGPVASLRRRG